MATKMETEILVMTMVTGMETEMLEIIMGTTMEMTILVIGMETVSGKKNSSLLRFDDASI